MNIQIPLRIETIFIFALAVSHPGQALAQSGALLEDVNGDGAVTVLAFGDSITYGVGDESNPGDYVEAIDDAGKPRGYPKRLSAKISAGVENAGVPGERFLWDGVSRAASLVIGSDVDTVIFMEGANDAVHRMEGRDYRIGLQRLINVVRAEGKGMLLNTVTPPAGSHASLAPYTTLYSSIVRDLAVINSLSVADVEQKFRSTCPDLDSCQLYNLPEGLHPNTLGYDAIAQVVLDALGG